MKVEELRIGNIVYSVNRKGDVHLLEEVPLVVVEISQFFIKTYPLGFQITKVSSYIPFSVKDIEPIPLNEEWLVSFGFEENGIYLSKGNLLFHKEHGLWSWFGNYIIIPRSVHQLQNLYFALTGEELILKL